MESGVARRVLIVEDHGSIRNVLWYLLTRMGYESEVAVCARQALSMIKQEDFDAVLLDFRSVPEAEHMVSQIRLLRPKLLGRILVVTGEVDNPAMLDWIARAGLRHVPKGSLLTDLRDWVRLLLEPAAPAKTA